MIILFKKLFLKWTSIINSLLIDSILIVLFLTFISIDLKAQEEKKDSTSYFDLYFNVGPYLPTRIEGITEILYFYGGNIAWSNGSKGYELELLHSQDNNIDYYQGRLGKFLVLPFEDLMNILFLAGIGYHRYKLPTEDEYKAVMGVYLGSGLEMKVVEQTWIKFQIRFNFNPGISLSIAFGLVFRY